jgi:hypothetical protein
MPSQRVTRLARIAVLGVLALGLFGCDVVSTVTEGFKESKAVENDLQQATGMRPDVGFEWKNGNLLQVTVAFPQLYDNKPIGELAAAVQHAVATEFKQKPQKILLTFEIKPGSEARSSALPETAQHAAL